jgi:uncharacterized membrane protein
MSKAAQRVIIGLSLGCLFLAVIKLGVLELSDYDLNNKAEFKEFISTVSSYNLYLGMMIAGAISVIISRLLDDEL